MSSVAPPQQDSEQTPGKTARLLLQQVPLANSQTAILARGKQLVAHRGDLKLAEAQDVAVSVAEEWDEISQTGRIQFMRLPLLPNERLLYTLRTGNGFLITITDSADAPLQRITRLAQQLREYVERAPLNGYNQSPGTP